MRLLHFSDDPAITRFEPRPVRTAALRPPGMGWLNGPLVWAIDDAHQPMYLFPRECPRILLWPTAATTVEDRTLWIGATAARVVAFIEAAWARAHADAVIYRYELPVGRFEDLHDAGMWVSRRPVEPRGMSPLTDLPGELTRQGAELRIVDSLEPLRAAYGSSLLYNGLRLRNADARLSKGNPPQGRTF